MIQALKNKILSGSYINRQEAVSLLTVDLEMLCSAADELRNHFCKNHFDLCTIINGKSGKCSEDCKYCAQSSHYQVALEEYPLLDTQTVQTDAVRQESQGILRYSIVTSGRSLTDTELEQICQTYQALKNHCNMALCASHGLLTYPQFVKLKEAGVTRYHNNLETSRRYFPSICTTHTYEDKIEAIKQAQKAGLSVCSGGIMGLGETMEDRIDMALELRELGVHSIPINILNPIKGTPFEHLPVLSDTEVRRIIAIYRFLLPSAALRLAGGRGLLSDKGELAFRSGANAAISGDMLTTAGISTEQDLKLLSKLGFEVTMI